jgi:dipeptidyl aminopeptidase/acylaminoacyl peptidase
MTTKLLASILLILLTANSRFAQPPRVVQLSDLLGLQEVSNAQISLDGKRIVFTVGTVSANKSSTETRLWVVSAQGGEVRRLTEGEANENTPRWSPDGRLIAFFSDRDKQHGLWVVALGESEPRLVTHVIRSNFFLTHAGEIITWAPESKRLAFLSSPEVLSDKTRLNSSSSGEGKAAHSAILSNIPKQLRRPLTHEGIDQLPSETSKRTLSAIGQASAPNSSNQTEMPLTSYLSEVENDPCVITRLMYKSRTAFSDKLQTHNFIADLSCNQIQHLTFGNYSDHSIHWSPKRDEIVFVSNREPDPDKVNNTDLFTINVSTRQLRQLTRTKGCEWTPFFSPNGQEIAFTATLRPITTIDSVAEDTHLFSISTQDGAEQGTLARELNNEQDRRVYTIRWSPDSQFVYFTASDHGKTMLYQATRLGSVRQLLDHEAQISGFSVGLGGALAMAICDPTHPAEIYATRTPGKFEPITKLNQIWLDTFQPMMPHQFTFQHDGMTVQGWVYPPVGLQANSKYPVVLSIHGGPHGMHGYAFNTTAQALAARGYGVLLIHPRGSAGYEQNYSDSCVIDWGGGDYRDLMKAVDEALVRFSYLDRDYIGVTGGSYGGYMTNWVVTQTDRFTAAVTVASLSNLISFYSTSLYQDLIHAEFNSFPWDNFELLWQRSPLKHIKKVKTPKLILHGEQDHDVHITQAEEFYTALKMREAETVFVRSPREGHGLRELRHRLDQLARTILSFDRYLTPRTIN